MSKLAVALAQCGAVGSITIEVIDDDKFRGMAALSGAAVSSEWASSNLIVESFTRTIDSVMIRFCFCRRPTVRDYTSRYESN